MERFSTCTNILLWIHPNAPHSQEGPRCHPEDFNHKSAFVSMLPLPSLAGLFPHCPLGRTPANVPCFYLTRNQNVLTNSKWGSGHSTRGEAGSQAVSLRCPYLAELALSVFFPLFLDCIGSLAYCFSSFSMALREGSLFHNLINVAVSLLTHISVLTPL